MRFSMDYSLHMPVDSICPTCKKVLPPKATRCSNCEEKKFEREQNDIHREKAELKTRDALDATFAWGNSNFPEGSADNDALRKDIERRESLERAKQEKRAGKGQAIKSFETKSLEGIEHSISVCGWDNLPNCSPTSFAERTLSLNGAKGHFLNVVNGNWQLRESKSGRLVSQGSLLEIQELRKNSAHRIVGNGMYHLHLKGSREGWPVRIRLWGVGYSAKLLYNAMKLLEVKDEAAFNVQGPQKLLQIDAVFAGGIGVDLAPNTLGTLYITNEEVQFATIGNTWRHSFTGLKGMQIGGQGLVQSGGGWVGGGFGIKGALKGAAFAEIMNLLTTKTSYDCFLRLVFPFPDADATFQILDRDPKKLELDLTGTRGRLESSSNQVSQMNDNSGIDTLVKLADLLDRGLISEDEFKLQKERYFKNS